MKSISLGRDREIMQETSPGLALSERACVFLNPFSRSAIWPNRYVMTLVKARVAVTAHKPSKYGNL